MAGHERPHIQQSKVHKFVYAWGYKFLKRIPPPSPYLSPSLSPILIVLTCYLRLTADVPAVGTKFSGHVT